MITLKIVINDKIYVIYEEDTLNEVNIFLQKVMFLINASVEMIK